MDYEIWGLLLLAAIAFIAYRLNQAVDYLLAGNELHLDVRNENSKAYGNSQRIVELLTEQSKLLARIADSQQIK